MNYFNEQNVIFIQILKFWFKRRYIFFWTRIKLNFWFLLKTQLRIYTTKCLKYIKKTFFKMSDSGTSLIRFTIALRLAQLWKSILFWLITFFVLILEKVFRWTKSLVEMLSHRNTPWITNMWRMKTGLYFRFLTQIVWNRLFFRFLYCRYYICSSFIVLNI